MTYLQLCQKVTTLSKITELRDHPLSTNGQVGVLERVVFFVEKAWTDIQSIHADWSFLWRESGDLSMVVGQQLYDLDSDINSIIVDSMVAIRDGNSSYTKFVPFEKYRKSYKSNSTQGFPTMFTVTPQDKLSFFYIPDNTYAYQFDYYANPITLSSDTDEPTLHVKYQDAIVYLALKYLGEYLRDNDMMMIGESEYQKLLTRMANELLPDLTNHEPLV